jgi:hypothetical protein
VTATFGGGTSPYTITISNHTTTVISAPVAATSPKIFGGLDAGTYTVVVTDARGCKASADITVQERACDAARCSYTQGYYGNNGGKGSPRIAFINGLLAQGDLTLGIIGQSSITFEEGTASCIIRRMPGGGPASALEDVNGNPVNITVVPNDGVCDSLDVLPLNKQGDRFRNNLLSQTLALALNLRILPVEGCTEALGTFELRTGLCKFSGVVNAGCITMGAKSGEVTGISQQVIDVLDDLFGSHTPADVVALANRALAGQTGAAIGNLSLSAIAGAAGAINEMFDECGFVDVCPVVNPL